MTQYTQADRPLRIDTALEEDVLLLQGFSGTEEISRPFAFRADLLSMKADIAPDDLLRTGAVITVNLPGGDQRRIHGIVSRFVQKGQKDELTSYQCDLVPWLWFLSLSRECRIFQEMSVLEIVEQVFRDQGYSDFESRCVGSYPSREYCVQYRETHLNFISRLLEEEGIFYFFEHTDSAHTLVLADDNSAFHPCPGPREVRIRPEAMPDEDVVTTLDREHAVYAGKVALADYDYRQPAFSLQTEMSGDGEEEVYDYHPERYKDLDQGDRYARLMLEREEAERHVVHGEGTCRSFQAGTTFDLKEHYRSDVNQTYVLTRVQHDVQAGYYRSDLGAGLDHRNAFVAVPQTIPYRPPRRARKTVVRGSHTAEVVGKKGEDIWVDEHGRIKVQFHWDREGKKDENSSCWVRVSQNWAGAQWGGMFVPHVGHEVIVDFLEGDPDRPIVTGRVYHANNTTPLSLPGEQTKSIIRDHGGNEIVMEGEDGAQQIRLFSPTEGSKIVLGAPNAGNIFFYTGGTQVARIVGRVLNEYGADFIENVLGSEFKTVEGATKVERKGSLNKMTMGAESSQNLSAKSTTTVGVEHSSFVGGKVSTSHAYTREVNRGWKKTTTTASSTETVQGPKELTSESRVEIGVGGAVITIANGVISIDADKVLINGSDKVYVESGGDIKLTPGGKVDIPKGKLDAKNLKEP